VRFHLEPLDATGNVRITFFFDPDGVLLEFIQGHLDHHEVWNADIVEEVRARPLPARPTFDHVAMTVRDHDDTVDFYRRTLGFDVGGRLFLSEDPRGFDISYLHAGETVIELFTFADDKSPSPWSADPTTIGFRHVGFAPDESSGATLDDVVDRLAEYGATPVAGGPCPLMLDRDGFPLRIGDA
jgi:catechol 2,3-dioxygenase-like lactoylglutathione lyase family enzyme